MGLSSFPELGVSAECGTLSVMVATNADLRGGEYPTVPLRLRGIKSAIWDRVLTPTLPASEPTQELTQPFEKTIRLLLKPASTPSMSAGTLGSGDSSLRSRDIRRACRLERRCFHARTLARRYSAPILLPLAAVFIVAYQCFA